MVKSHDNFKINEYKADKEEIERVNYIRKNYGLFMLSKKQQELLKRKKFFLLLKFH